MKTLKRTFLLLMVVTVLVMITSYNKIIASDFKPPEDYFVVSEKTSNIVPGVTEREVIYNSEDLKNPVTNYVIDINLGSNVGIMAATKDYNKRGTQTVREMAHAAEAATNRNVVVAINADLNWSGTGISNGPVIVDGVTYNDKPALFFGIKYNGEAVMGNAAIFEEVKDDLYQAVKGMSRLVEYGEVVATSTSLAPRTAVGLREDGSVFFYIAEGRGYPRSVGISLKDMAENMKELGAYWAINMDGGGSTTYLAKREGEETLEVRNLLSDGSERQSLSSLLVYAEPGDGIFNHANITSEGDIYTPESEVQFSAIGVDNGGGPAELPEGLTWALEDESFGSITNDGLFSANDNEGFVKVNLIDSNNRNVGSTTIEIRTPDFIEFQSAEFSVGYDYVTDFGIRVLYENRHVIYKEGDIIWDYDEELGTFINNVFTSVSETDGQIESTVTATIKNTVVEASFILTIGQEPIILYDFEDDEINELWGSSTAGKGEVSNATIVDRESGEPVRFGDKALRLDFDYTEAGGKPWGVYATLPSSHDLVLPGKPTAIGVWVYGTEENQGLWLRMGILGANDASWAALSLTDDGGLGNNAGINWLGWKYVEADLTSKEAPIKFIASQILRLMITTSAGNAPDYRPVGSVYFDNITVSYGSTNEDLHNPVIDDVYINEELFDDEIIILEDNKFNFKTALFDYEDRNATGIDNYYIYLDGNDITERIRREDLEESVLISSEDIYVSSGTHKLEILAIDGAGNETSEIIYLKTLENSDDLIYLKSENEPVLGRDYIVSLKADDLENIEDVLLSLQLSRYLMDYEIIVNPNFEVEEELLPGIFVLNLNITRKDEEWVLEDDYVLQINFVMANDLHEFADVAYSVNRSYFNLIEPLDPSIQTSFSMIPSNVRISAPFKIKTDTPYIDEEVKVYVLDRENNPVEGASIYKGATMLGVTNEDGYIYVIFETTEEFILSAEKDEDIAFDYKGQTFGSYGEVDGTPYNIKLNAVKNPETIKNISWYSNKYALNKDAIVQYALKEDYLLNGESAFLQVQGTPTPVVYDGSMLHSDNYVVNVNNVTIDGLENGKEYVYRVGNGEVWSEIREFNTGYKKADTTFLILGDIQTGNYENLANNIENIINSDSYDFVVQTGDMIDDGARFDYWNPTLNTFSESKLNHLEMIHVLGNHEFYGDEQGDRSIITYNLEHPYYYSYEYGNVYFAVINYLSIGQEFYNALEWLETDSNNSDAKWKVLLTHQPPYYTSDSGSPLFNELLPPVLERSGFDFVFSGHDHSYARTKAMINQTPDDDGITYIISGAFGEKGYDATARPEFHFEVMTNEHEIVYLSVEVKENTFTITAYDGETLMEIDSYTKTKHYDHEHSYILKGDRLVCEECNYNRPLEDYIGFLKDEEGHIMYQINNQFQKELLILANDKYYFDNNGYALIGEHDMWGIATTFDENGKLISGGTGFTREYQANKLFYLDKLENNKLGWFQVGDDYYFASTTNREIITGKSIVRMRNGKHITQTFDSDGKLIRGTFVVEDGEIYYYFGLSNGWIEVDGYKYYVSTNGTYKIRMSGTTMIDLHKGTYTFNDRGQLIVGAFVKEEGGTRYYFGEQGPNKYETGFQEIDGDLYYFDEDGFMQTGEFEIEGFRVYANDKGIISFDND